MAVVACVLAGCSLITSTDGLQGGGGAVLPADAGDAAVIDGGGPPPDGGPSDAGADAKRPAPVWELAAASGPGGRHSMSIAYDGTGLLLYGGTAGQNTTTLSDTWRWDGKVWSKLAPLVSPRPWYGHTLVTAKDGRVWMALGRSNDDKAFSWDGATWAPMLGGNPTDRTTAAAYDSDRGVLVALDTDNASRELRHWEYDGTTWRALPLATPPERRGARMVYDSIRKRTVLFGGRELLDDTWEYDGARWERRLTPTSPAGRQGFCMAYDPSRAVTVLFGGGAGGNAAVGAETWEYDGATWTKGPAGPPTRRSCALAYDPNRRRLVLYGGVYQVAGDGGYWNGARDDTWLY